MDRHTAIAVMGLTKDRRFGGPILGAHYMVSGLLQPYIFLYLINWLTIANLWHKRRESRGRLLFLTLALASLTIFSLPGVSYFAMGSLEWQFPPLKQRPTDADAIVVLAGYIIPSDETRPRTELGVDTLDRCLHAADIYHQGRTLPILVSGGKVDPRDPGPSCAQLMRNFLKTQGVEDTDLMMEDRSRNTHENAIESCKQIKQRGFKKVILVTDAAHLYRAIRCFRKQGIGIIPSGCRYRATQFELDLFTFLPSPYAAEGCLDVFHEWLGVVWYHLRGWI